MQNSLQNPKNGISQQAHFAVLDWIAQYSYKFYSSHTFLVILAEVFTVTVISAVLVLALRWIPGVRYILG